MIDIFPFFSFLLNKIKLPIKLGEKNKNPSLLDQFIKKK